MTRPRLGYLPDKHDPRDVPFACGVDELPATVSLRSSVGAIFDQGNTESCVANALSQAIALEEKAANRPADVLSRLHVYWHARSLEGPIVDRGCRIRDAVKSLQNLGAPRESVWPFDVSKVNQRPSWAAEREGFSRRSLSGYARIVGLQAIRSALAAGHPVVGGWAVDEAFLSAAGPHLVESFGASVGGHCMCIVGYDETSVEVVNSWGPLWRDHGFCRLSNDATLTATDMWSVELV